MSNRRKTSPNEVYFITLTVSGWTDLFSRECYRKILIENFAFCQKNQGLEIFVYVIMTNHVHLICRRTGGDLNELLGRFKGFTSKALLRKISENMRESRREWLLHQFTYFAKKNAQYGEFHLWRAGNYPVLVNTPTLFEQKRNYIHQNPVKAGIVTRPENYLYSSACPDSPLRCDIL